MERIRVQTQDGFVGRRTIPIAHTLIAGTTSGAANTVLTVRDGVQLQVKHLSVVNTSVAPATITLHAVPASGSIATANAELVDYSIAAHTAADLTDLIGQYYAPGTTLEAWAGTTNVLVVHGWAEEIL